MSKSSFIVVLALFGLVSCANKDDTDNFVQASSNIESLNQELSSNSNSSSSTVFSLDNDPISSGESVVGTTKKLCELISNKNLHNPFEYEKYFAESSDFSTFLRYTVQIEQLSSECTSADIVFDHYPISIVKFNLVENNSLYGIFRVNKEKKIHQYSFIPASNLSIEHKDIVMDDGNTLSSLLIKLDNTKRTTVLIKTPYLHTNGAGMYMNMAIQFLDKGHNVLLQSNRGSHASTGVFKWLHEKNIEDSKNSIDWITGQEFSNKKVISFGISYDGYNALAAAASNAEGLISTVACSAPSKASTDSFTAGESVESTLLSYIAERENPNDIGLFYEKFYYLENQNISYDEFDNILYGRDIADWSDLMDAKRSGDLKSYMSERSILEKLKESKVSIFHVAGTDHDQDGRDTILAYEYLKNESYTKKNNFLYLHHYGHGCGEFFTKEFGEKFLSGDTKSLKNEYRELSNGETSSDIENDFIKTDIKLFSLNITSELSNRESSGDDQEIFYKGKSEEDITVNGSPVLKVNVSSSLWRSSVIVSLFHSADGTYETPHSMASNISRTSFYMKDNTEGEISLILPPMKFHLKKGEDIIIKLSMDTQSYIDFFRVERSNYYEDNQESGLFEVIDPFIKLSLPVEDKKIAEEEV